MNVIPLGTARGEYEVHVFDERIESGEYFTDGNTYKFYLWEMLGTPNFEYPDCNTYSHFLLK
jgi:hypothetical protein